MEWKIVKNELPPTHTLVETKIDDGNGERNIQYLKRVGNLWFVADGSMYVYYTPTHWRDLQDPLNA